MPSKLGKKKTVSKASSQLSKKTKTTKKIRSQTSKKTRITKKTKQTSRKTTVSSTQIKNDTLDINQFHAWSDNVIQHLETNKTLKAASNIYLIQRLFVVFDGDTSGWQAVDEKKNGRIFNLYNSNRGDGGEVSTYFHRSPYRRQSTQMTRYIATDFRGLTHYTAINDAKWLSDVPTLTFNAKEFTKNGKKTPVKTFIADILKTYFKSQKSKAKTLKASNDPSTDKDVANNLEALLKSMQEIMGDDTVSVRFAYATFNPDRTPNRSAPLRLFVPAKTVNRVMDAYYVRERNADTRSVSFRKCKNKECDDRYLAVDVDDDKKIVADAFLSINEPELTIKYHAVKQ